MSRNYTIKVWRQEDAKSKGKIVTYPLENISPDCSFLEMLDILNHKLIKQGDDPITYDHDCREGICGMCALVINGIVHGPMPETTTCQLHMRTFKDGDTIVIEPLRAKAFPIIKDLMVDRSAMDRVMAAGGFVSVNTGSAPEANAVAIARENAELAMDAAACVGCGSCVAACQNSSAMLFVAAKISQFALLPQGKVEAKKRARAMVAQMDKEGFGNCTNEYECVAVCPKNIKQSNIARLNREFIKQMFIDGE